MSNDLPAYTLIQKTTDLEDFVRQHAHVPWICFDTEFIGEKRYQTLLCLIQIASPKGFFLLDPLSDMDLSSFLSMVSNPSVEKITHAGENDFRLLFEQYDTLPRNVFDTQIAAGMVGYRYPMGFAKLVNAELSLRLSKGHTVTDWEARPLSKKQVQYAIDDVRYLHPLREKLGAQIARLDRQAWVEDEFARLERARFYERDPDQDALSSRLMRQVKPRDQVFLLRLYRWRRHQAKQRNHSLEMVLPKKMIGSIVRAVGAGGKKGLAENRRISNRITKKYGDTFERMYAQKPRPEELEVLQRLPEEEEDDPRVETLLELIYQAVRYRCLEWNIAHELAFPRTVLKSKKVDPELEVFQNGWRRDLLGDALVRWINNIEDLDVQFGQSGICLTSKTAPAQ